MRTGDARERRSKTFIGRANKGTRPIHARFDRRTQPQVERRFYSSRATNQSTDVPGESCNQDVLFSIDDAVQDTEIILYFRLFRAFVEPFPASMKRG
jgi:hypothetical protein